MKLLILLALAACNTTPPKKAPQVTLPPIIVEQPEMGNEKPKSGITFKIVESTTKGNEVELLNKAIGKFNEVYGSQCFVDFMSKQKMNWTNGKTTKQVVEHLLSLKGEVPVRMYYNPYGNRSLRCPKCSTAVAFRQPPSKTINLNRDFFTSKQTSCRWAGTLMHEGLGHALGEYGHSMKWTRQREDTVPYLMSGRKNQYGGDVFDACCR